MNQASVVPFGTDASKLAGYAMTANERLGAIDFIFENTGSIPAYIKVMAYVGPSTTPSGYSGVTPLDNEINANVEASTPSSEITGFTSVGAAFVVQPKGVLTRSYNLLSKRIGFFGSGIAGNVQQQIAPYQTLRVASTTVNISAVLRNPSDLRGAQIDISPVGRQGWGFDPAMDTPNLTKHWGSVDPTTGLIDLGEKNYNEPGDTSGGPAGVVGTPA
jgi:hypothetical protein